MMRNSLFVHLSVCLAVVLSASLTAWSADGWDQIWQNAQEQARTTFQAKLAQHPHDASALYGLAMLNDAEGDEVGALLAWQQYYQVAPASWQAMAYWQRVVELAESTGRYPALEAITASVLAAHNAPVELQASARLAQAAAEDRAGHAANAEHIWAQMGYLRQWRIIGPFDNVSKSGFAKAFPPEQEIDFHQSYMGLDDQQLVWHSGQIVARNGHVEIGTSLGDNNESVFYAVTALYAAQAQPVMLCFDPEGASQVMLNGATLFADEHYRSPRKLVADPFRIPAQLQPGWNTLLLKIMSNEKIVTSFAVRITTPTGSDLPGLRADPTQAKHATLTPLHTTASVETATAVLLRAQPMHSDIALALGYQLCSSNDEQASADVLRAALATMPQASWLHWELSQTLRQDEQSDAAREEREKARALNARLAGAELMYLGEQDDELPAAQFLQLAKKIHARFPEAADALWMLSGAFGSAEMKAESLDAARAAAKIEAGPAGQKLLMDGLSEADRKNESIDTLTSALQRYPNAPELLVSHAELLQEKGKTSEAIACYQRLLQMDTPWPQYRQQLATLYTAAGNKLEAANQLRVAHAQCPQDADYSAHLAEALRELGNKAEAIPLYKDAIRLNPQKVEWRERLQILSGEKPVLSLLPQTDADPILKDTVTMKAPSGTSALVLLNESITLLYPDFASDTHRHLIVKIFDAAGVKRFQDVGLDPISSTGQTTVEKARLLKGDGKIQDCTDKAVGRRASFPSLAPGDTIELIYRVEDYHPGALAHQFWTEWNFASSDTPVKLTRFALISTPKTILHTSKHGAVPDPKVTEVKGWRISEWRMNDVPADKEEPEGTDFHDHGLWLDMSTTDDWKDIVSWYRDLAGPRCVPDAAIRAKAGELTKNAKTEEEKIRALVAFVSHDIQYQSMPFRYSQYLPTEGKQVLREHFGDCKDKAALLAALLAAVQVPADMVLVNGRSDGVDPYLPSPRFTHAINCIHTANGPLWVDATADLLTFGNLPLEDQDVPALIIAPSSTELTKTPVLKTTTNVLGMQYDVTLDAANKLSGEELLTFTGNWAWMLRGALQKVPESKYDLVANALLAKFSPNAVADNGVFVNINDPEKPFIIKGQFHIENYTTSAGNFIFFPLPWSGINDDAAVLISAATRTEDVEMPQQYGEQHTILHLTLPAGYAPEEVPPLAEKHFPWGKDTTTFKFDGHTLTGQWDSEHTLLRIAAADYAKFRESVKADMQEEKKPIVLKKQ